MPANDSALGASRSKTHDSAYQSIIDDEPDVYKKLLRANGIYSRKELNHFDTFYRFPRLDPYNYLGTTREYVFFTKPDLHIFSGMDKGRLNDEIANMPFFLDLMQRGYGGYVLRDLQYSIDPSTPFVRLLTNSKTSNLDLSAISVDDIESASNMYGTKVFYRKASDHSDEENDFSLEFEDSRWLETYLWFKAFDEYERKKYEGKVTPPNEFYTRKKVLHDQMTIFKFIVAEDGETIVHHSILKGCYPKSVPRESFSDLSGDGHLKFTTHWKCTFQKDCDPVTISHFNYLATLSQGWGTSQEALLWDPDIQAISGEDVMIPYVSLERVTNTKYSQYKLKWKK